MNTRIVVEKVSGRGVYTQVYDKNGDFFMGSPLSLNIPREPSELVYLNKEDLKIRHDKWEKKCEEKITSYLHKVFNHSLYGDLDISFEGFKLEGADDE